MEVETINNNGTTTESKIDKKKLKFQKKKDQKKKQKLKKQLESKPIPLIKPEQEENNGHSNGNGPITMKSSDIGFEINESDPTFDLFSKLLNHFDGNDKESSDEPDSSTAASTTDIQESIDTEKDKDNNDSNKNKDDSDNSEDEGQDKNKEKKISNRERKRQRRANLPILKQLVDRPDVVELHDVNSPNPGLLISLKSTRNTIAVPAHWCQKRKYLQGKRGYVKPPFELPSFIAATGISKIRDALLQKEQKKNSKQKQRERLQPKMRSMDIDYEVLRDAFFIHQTKPKLTVIGDLYYEGKEFEVNIKNKKPGVLSEELKRALGMVEGSPPPWLIYMQSFGPPPSYPNLKVPGVNAPIPEGAQYGTHIGGWGKPILNEFGRPLYEQSHQQHHNQQHQQKQSTYIIDNGQEILRDYWGELVPEEEIDEDEGEDQDGAEDQENMDQDMQDGENEQQQQQQDESDGISSVPSGLETPDIIDIKKSYNPNAPKQLYQVLDQQRVTNNNNTGYMESTHRYQIPSIIKTQNSTAAAGKGSNRVDIIKSNRTGPVDITFSPSELENLNEISEDLIKKKYEQTIAQNNNSKQSKEDYSDIIEEQSKKRKQQLQMQKEQDKVKKFKF